MPQTGSRLVWYRAVIYEGRHFTLKFTKDPVTGETLKEWVWEEGTVQNLDENLWIPKARSTGEKFPMVPPPARPDSSSKYTPMLVPYWDTPAVGTRYCQQLKAYVPEHLPYKAGRIAPAQKAPLRERLFTRDFWQRSSSEDNKPLDRSEGDASTARVEIKLVRAKDGTSVLAEGLTYHQSALIPVRQAQKDVGIKYRSLTAEREDLIPFKLAGMDDDIKYRTVPGCF
ncbi:hypothetical protein C8Q79DRAFT_1012178 [Trametes meyenii]|nr:hypothetical protein C8Q79DRAFT_1012178 [Trametes meyenii]